MAKKLSWLLLTVVAWAGIAAPAQGETLTSSSGAKMGGSLAIKAGHLLDVRTGKLTTNVFIVVTDGRIKSIGASAPAPGTEVIDLSGQTVMPGFIDCHEHLLGNLTDWSPMSDLRMSSPMKALWGVRNLQVWLREGFTTLRDAGESDPSYGQIALRDAVKQGLIQGPRILAAGSFISLTGGHGDAAALAPEWELPRQNNIADTVPEIDAAVRRDIKFGADWIKLMASGGVSDPLSDATVQELSGEQMAEAVRVAHRAHKGVMAHAHALAGIRAAVEAGVDSIEHGSVLDDETAALMAKKGTWLVPTFYIEEHGLADGEKQGLTAYSMDKERALIARKRATFPLALKYHVRIAFGVDDQPEAAPKEFDAMVRAGMKPLEAIQAATMNGAELLGLSGEIGSIEVGKIADIVAVQGAPLDDVRVLEHVGFVMKQGVVVKNENVATH
jgi:imidazolonepropionase-like amidohydrolase